MSPQPFRRFPALAAAFWLALTGTGPAAALDTDPPLAPNVAETEWQWIGVLPPGTPSCPPPDATSCAPGSAAAWSHGPLFDALAAAAYPPLAEFCLYEHIDPALPVDTCPIRSLAGGDLDAVEPDRMSATLQGTDLGGLTWRDLESHYERHVGKIALPVDVGARKVRLALLDTSPTTGMNPQNLPESSPHGRTLRLLLENLLCSDGECVAEITTRLALAYKTGLLANGQMGVWRDPVQGGFFGSLGDLARAISDEHTAWALSGGAEPLVLNLSLGWPPGAGSVPPDFTTMLPAAKAVYRALEAASCQGVLVVAASGNRADDRPPVHGPLLPAAWAGRTLPANGFCPLGDQQATMPPAPQLLYAAGGVRSDGEPLANATAASSPLRVAYSDHVVIEDPAQPTTPSPVLTGSSVAAAVLSATAAAVVYYRPDLPFAGVLDQIYQSGDALGRNADFCAAPPCAGVRSISLCAAVRRACVGGVALCPRSLPSCPVRSAQTPSFTADFSAFEDELAVTQITAAQLSATYPPISGTETCTPDPLPKYDPRHAAPADPCPTRQFYGGRREPWTDPQPNSDPCPNCLILRATEDSTLYVEIDEDYSGGPLSDPILKLCSGTYSLNAARDLRAGDSVRFTGLPADNCATATLSFTALDRSGGGKSSVTSAVLIGDE